MVWCSEKQVVQLTCAVPPLLSRVGPRSQTGDPGGGGGRGAGVAVAGARRPRSTMIKLNLTHRG